MFSTTYKINQNICQRLKFVFSLDKYYAAMNSRIILNAGDDDAAIEQIPKRKGERKRKSGEKKIIKGNKVIKTGEK